MTEFFEKISLGVRLTYVKNLFSFLINQDKGKFFLILALKLASQLFELIALLLPLKIILIISSHQKPLLLSQFFVFLDVDDWAWIFFGLSVSLFMVSMLSEVLAKRKISGFSFQILSSESNFSGRIELSSTTLNNLFKICADFIQFIVGILFLLLTFPIAVISWGLSAFLSFSLATYLIKSNRFFRKAFQLMLLDQRHLIRNIFDFNFMLMFVCILISLMIFKENQSHIFLVFVSILIARRVFQSIAQAFNGYLKLTFH